MRQYIVSLSCKDGETGEFIAEGYYYNPREEIFGVYRQEHNIIWELADIKQVEVYVLDELKFSWTAPEEPEHDDETRGNIVSIR